MANRKKTTYKANIKVTNNPYKTKELIEIKGVDIEKGEMCKRSDFNNQYGKNRGFTSVTNWAVYKDGELLGQGNTRKEAVIDALATKLALNIPSKYCHILTEIEKC